MILNVDDHEAGRYAKSRMLKLAGYEVAEAATGARALELVAELRPLLVMLDVNLPDMSGLEVCRLIKGHAASSATPVLQISASAITTLDQVDGLENGADAYLIEPVDNDVLVATVRALLRMRKAEADVVEANNALQAANELLRRSNDGLQQFSYAASHDLREPLRSISCFAGLLEKKYSGKLDADADKMLSSIQQGVSRMTSLIEALLIFAQAGQIDREEWTQVDLSAVLESALKDMEQSITESKATVGFEPLPKVNGSEVLFSQLFQNLIQNALKYRLGDAPPQVYVSAALKPRNMVTITISDKGMGIPAQYQHKIFAPFQRLHGSEVAGHGIGLATCQRIVEGHGGRIWVESAGAGKGSAFCFTLPLSE